MSKALKLEIVVAVCAVASFLISRFNPNKDFFWLAIFLGVSASIGAVCLKIAADNRKKEICLQKRPKDWFLEKTNYWNTRLEIDAKEHGKGSNINVRWEFVEYQHFDLDSQIENGNITIKYKRNNYPINPKIPLRIYISGR